MGTEPVEELPDDLEAWVAERAAAADTSRADVVRRLMAAHQLLDEHPDQLDDADIAGLGDSTAGAPDGADSGVDDLDARLDDLAERVEGLESDLDEKITDVRERVIQVKREADDKAPAEHDHPSIERRIDDGFGDYEEILESLIERTEALEDGAEALEHGAEDRGKKLSTVANAVVDLRRRMSAVEGVVEERAAVAALREEANRRGVTEAACDSCGNPVQLGLLDKPTCPHCESPFDGVEPGGWFRSSRLTVGDRPALESGRAAQDTNSENPESSASVPDRHEASGSEATGADTDPAVDPTADGETGTPADGGSESADVGWAVPPESQENGAAEADGDEEATD